MTSTIHMPTRPDAFRHLEALECGHFDNLVALSPKLRVFRSRMTVADGAEEDRQVFIEELLDGVWQTTFKSRGNLWVGPDHPHHFTAYHTHKRAVERLNNVRNDYPSEAQS